MVATMTGPKTGPSQLSLVHAPIIPERVGVRFLQTTVREGMQRLAEEGQRFDLIVADPPWGYSKGSHRANPESHYQTSQNGSAWIAEDLGLSCQLLAGGPERPRGLLVVWCTWPKLQEWQDAVSALERDRGPQFWPWGGALTGGAWAKWNHQEDKGAPGAGYVWTGDSEPVLIYRSGPSRDTFRDRSQLVRNAWFSPRGRHSEKPVGWMRQWLRRWTPPGAIVLDLFAGLAPLARACVAEGREYVGIEMDPDRLGQARALLAQYRPDQDLL